MRFKTKLRETISENRSCLCVGLDPNLDLIPPLVLQQFERKTEAVTFFLKRVIDATHKHCAAYKPNLGFFEALGADGWDVFKEILDYIPDEKILIADAKRGDISSTAEHYAKAFFDIFDVDAVTLNPLMGFETLDPFLDYSNKGIFVLTLTSNPGSADFLARPTGDYDTLAAYIADQLRIKQKSSTTDIGMVLGATKAHKLEHIFDRFPDGSLLIPGIGKQGGSVKELVDALHNHKGLALVNSSRSIIFAGNQTDQWQKAISQKAKEMKANLAPLVDKYV